ncbi:MAG: DUF177 domain-containing protein [Thermomicrobiales bacterium]|nr:DUF177 domain-containing protein [Thermomicrobiales bacterium]MCO5222387.1 DUF177 domain-containing protein [Thermomicrobiales bacterium]
MDLYNETAVNVATLLQEPVGSSRSYGLHLDRLELDSDLVARDVNGELRLTRLSDEILANVTATATVGLTCLRCLEQYEQPTKTRFQEEFRIAYDVRSGAAIRSSDDDERFAITDAHELNILEPLRQELIVSLPMRPDCGDACPGPAVVSTGGNDEIDDRFAALGALLNSTNED